MPSIPKRKRKAPAKVAPGVAHQVETQRLLRASVKRAKDIRRLSRQLQKENDRAQRALWSLAMHLVDRSEHDAAPARPASGDDVTNTESDRRLSV